MNSQGVIVSLQDKLTAQTEDDDDLEEDDMEEEHLGETEEDDFFDDDDDMDADDMDADDDYPEQEEGYGDHVDDYMASGDHVEREEIGDLLSQPLRRLRRRPSPTPSPGNLTASSSSRRPVTEVDDDDCSFGANSDEGEDPNKDEDSDENEDLNQDQDSNADDEARQDEPTADDGQMDRQTLEALEAEFNDLPDIGFGDLTLHEQKQSVKGKGNGKGKKNQHPFPPGNPTGDGYENLPKNEMIYGRLIAFPSPRRGFSWTEH
jgi:hypothetical protein